MKYMFEFSRGAAEDVEQLFDFALQPELDSAIGDLEIPTRAMQVIKDRYRVLGNFSLCRSQGGEQFFCL